MQAGHYSSLLPDVFRHASTQVRVFQPQVILLDFHGTISERRWEDKVIFPYVKRSVTKFLLDNWTSDAIQKCIPGLKNESFEQRFRHKYDDAPIIDDQYENEDLGPSQLAHQVGDFLQWQMNTKRETKETQTIERLVWQDGFRRKQLATPLYDDVLPAIKAWKESYGCAIYVISSIEPESLKLIFESTDKGNLHQYLNGYISSKKMGEKLISDTYKRLHEQLVQSKVLVTTKARSSSLSLPPPLSAGRSSNSSRTSPPANRSPQTSPGSERSNSARSQSRRAAHPGSPKSSRSPRKRSSSPSQVEPRLRPILFLTDSGQEAKAAAQVGDGSVFECLLVNRPGNKRFRTYYLVQFQYVDRFSDIEFVP